jgi:hypothetical protein
VTPDELSARQRAAEIVAREAGSLAQSYLDGDALTAGHLTIAATPALYAAIAGGFESSVQGP